MTTLVLQAAGSALGTAVAGPFGGAVGGLAGALAGGVIDAALFGSGAAGRVQEGPRLRDLDGISATEGAPVPRLYGRARLGGQVIWATRLEEVATASRSAAASGGKGGGGGRKAASTSVAYAYFANVAVALCEGPVALVRRVWADGRELDLAGVTMRFYPGDEEQAPDPLIVAKQGEAPAYRGVAYVVFERLALAPFGNRLPQLAFEVVRPVGRLAARLRGVNLIPGATEFGYEPAPVAQVLGLGASTSENRHQLGAGGDWDASLDALQAICPRVRSVALVSSWFGDDLRAGHCTVAPRVEIPVKATLGSVPGTGRWRAAGLEREDARVVSRSAGAAAYGGTPDDAALVRAIRDLKARGLSPVLYPFVMMDVPAGNALPDPWTGAASQPAYPWRGRITVDPAPGRPGTADATPAADAQVAAFFGAAAPGDFSIVGDAVVHAGPQEWSFRRHVLHHAWLAKLAGGVDGFVIGSEMVGLTRARSAPGAYPAVAHLVALAADVRSVLGGATGIGYAADWTEYGAQVLDGGAEVRFPLDPLWASPSIDFVGIDHYPPVADWRDGEGHLDAAGWDSGHDAAYLGERFGAGEAHDWHYPTPAAREAQARAPITDGAYGKPWTYRAKDIAGWWANAHVERVGGVELPAPTAWVPGLKPVWLTEVGCPAVDKGANAPNLFPDPKSAESGRPPFSSGRRDDLIQARLLVAALDHFAPGAAGNPLSPLTGLPMIDPARVHAWAWDARPFPAFPRLSGVWADAPNWELGHWLNGRIEGAPLDDLVRAILDDYGLPEPLAADLDGFADGYVIDRPMSARAALEPLLALYGARAVASGGAVRFDNRRRAPLAVLGAGDLVPAKGPGGGEGAPFALSRAQETELPAGVTVTFTDAEGDYRRAEAGALRRRGASRRAARADAALVTRRAEAARLAEGMLAEAWAGRETAAFTLPPSLAALEVGDVVALVVDGAARPHRLTRLTDGAARRAEARAVAPGARDLGAPAEPPPPARPPTIAGPPLAVLLDLPLLDPPLSEGEAADPPALQHLAATASPWPGGLGLWRAGGGGFALAGVVPAPAMVGRLTAPLAPGPVWRVDRVGAIELELSGGALASVADDLFLAGANRLAVRGPEGAWEVVAFAAAALTGPRRWRLTRLLRGLDGTEGLAARAAPAGAAAVVLDGTLLPLAGGVGALDTPADHRLAPLASDAADPFAGAFRAAPGPTALRPRAPVRARAMRGEGGVRLTWTRRTRRGGDAWEAAEVPLAEEAETYALDLLDADGAVRRTLGSAGPSVLYPAALELVDFGAPRAVLEVAIHQLSTAVGRGAPLRARLEVRPAA